ncbi:MAG TPA: hypothetical protein VNO31_34585, partial [Umezawaea sp.]|nr:hypothetical protein [Umezawaea sp.]
MRICRPRRVSGSTSSCTSSRINLIGRGSRCRAAPSSARNSGWAAARGQAHGPCRRLSAGTDGQAATPAITDAHSRSGSL